MRQEHAVALIIAGLEEVDRGTVEIAGKVVNHVRPKDRDIAMVFQNYALYPYMKVYENISFGLRMRKTPDARRFAAASRTRPTSWESPISSTVSRASFPAANASGWPWDGRSFAMPGSIFWTSP